MLQIYSTVYENTLRKINSHAYITKTYHEGKPLPIDTFVLKRNFTHVHISDKLKPLRIGPYKILDRLSDVTYELLAQNGSTVHVHRNHLIPYYPKEPLLYPHLRNFMRFSDTTQFQIPQPTRYANSDSSPFNSDESLSEEDSQTFVTPPSFSTSNQNTPSITSNDKSLTSSTNDNSLYRHLINTPHTNVSSDRSRHSSNNQTTSLPPLIDRTTKTTYKLRQQPKLDYRLFITPSKLYHPQNDPRFPILAERFINNNDLLSHKRKETELKRLQTPNLELKFEVKVKFQGLNPHPIFHVSKIEHKTSPTPFEVVHIEFERDLNIPTITYGKIVFCNPYSGLKYTTSF